MHKGLKLNYFARVKGPLQYLEQGLLLIFRGGLMFFFFHFSCELCFSALYKGAREEAGGGIPVKRVQVSGWIRWQLLKRCHCIWKREARLEISYIDLLIYICAIPNVCYRYKLNKTVITIGRTFFLHILHLSL